MTLEELQKNWKDYALVRSSDDLAFPLKNLFMICWGPMKGGLLFDAGGSQGAPACILKPDEDDGCLSKTDLGAPDSQAWQLIGKLIKSSDPDNRKKKKSKRQRKRTRSGGKR